MEIQSTNVFDQMRLSGRRSPFSQPYMPTFTMQKDTCSLSGDIVTVVLDDASEDDSGIINAKMNNKNGHLKISEPRRHEAWLEGDIAGKRFLIHKEEDVYSGSYGNKQFSFSVDAEQPPSWLKKQINKWRGANPYNCNYFNVAGTMNGEHISLNMPSAKIPQDEDFKDMLSILLWVHGKKAKTINGEIKTIEHTMDGIKQKNYRQELKDKKDEKLWQNPIFQTVLTVLSTLGIQWLTKKFLNTPAKP